MRTLICANEAGQQWATAKLVGNDPERWRFSVATVNAEALTGLFKGSVMTVSDGMRCGLHTLHARSSISCTS